MDIPAQKTIPFARDGNKNSIPTSGTSTDENASYQMGFPPRTMADDATAVPPTGEDVNGILNELSKASIYQQAGGLYPFNGTYAQAIGGYPLGAIVRKSDGSGIWFNSVANNMTDPDGSSASGWILAIGDFLEKSGGTMTGDITFASTQTLPVDIQQDNQAVVSGEYVYVGQTSIYNGNAVTSNKEISLSSILPNDGYVYLCSIRGAATTPATSGTQTPLYILSDLHSQIPFSVCSAQTRTSSTMTSRGTINIPVGAGRNIYLYGSSGYVGTVAIDFLGYRRLYKA